MIATAQLAIEQNLLVPKSAKYSNETVLRNGDLYLVQGMVESLNAFGVMIPQEYIVEIKNNTIIYIKIGDSSAGEYIPLNN